VLARLGGFDACRPNTFNYHALWFNSRLIIAVRELSSCFWVLDTGNRQAFMEMADACLIATNTSADKIMYSMLCFGRPIRVTD
jgi:hypothetical protein